MVHFLLQSILFGFGCYSMAMLLIPHSTFQSANIPIEKLDKIACILFSIAGILFVTQWAFQVYPQMNPPNPVAEQYLFRDRMFGPYGWAFWIVPLLYLPATQLLWFSRIRKSKWVRGIIAFLMVISIEQVVVILTSLHQDFLPSSWSILGDTSVLSVLTYRLLYIALFAALVIGIYTGLHLTKAKNAV